MKEHFNMSAKEIDRIPIVERLTGKEMTVKQAAEALALSTRQVKRLKKCFGESGSAGLVHRNRGRKSKSFI